jgi:hypothetical protein
MTAVPMRLNPTLIRALLGGIACAALSSTANAAPSAWRCDNGQELVGEFTPKAGQLRMGDQSWSLQRVRDVGEARYVDRRKGATLTMARSQAVLTVKGQPSVSCKLVVRALEPDAMAAGRRAQPPER